MDISQVAKASGLPASTLRFYEEKGLIESIGRQGLKRVFSEKVLERLALISLGRSAGFTLEELAEMFREDGNNINRTLLLTKAEELDAKNSRANDHARWSSTCSCLSGSQSL